MKDIEIVFTYIIINNVKTFLFKRFFFARYLSDYFKKILDQLIVNIYF